MPENRLDYDHIVLVSIDTLRSDAMASSPVRAWPAKYRTTRRPRRSILDELAASSAWFPNCVSAAPYTSASHASFLTGHWPLRHGVHELFNRALRTPTLLANARAAGYRTMMKVDFPLMLGEHLGFTREIDEYIVRDDDAAVRFIEGNRRACTFIHFSGAHIPYGFGDHELSTGEFARVLDAVEQECGTSRRRPRTSAGSAAAGPYQRYLDIVDHLYRSGDYSTLFSMYLDGVDRFLVTRFAPVLRRILAALDGRRALLVVFGDHGEEYDAESFAHQNSLSDGVLRVPLMIHGDGVAPGCHRSRVRSIDLVPSIHDLVGPLPPAEADGASLAATIAGGDAYPVRDAFAQSYIADGREHARQVKQALLRPGSRGPLPHTLIGEAAYVGPWRVVRRLGEQYLEDGAWRVRPVEPRVRFERERPDSTWEAVAHAEPPPDVLARLDRYNALAGEAPADRAGAAGTADSALRDQLRLLGYRI
ncbi:hypothetical protein GCM10010191_11340 [Actinomadura vinacea]|uniref:Sulfatase N-terminal domain-containing protein n=1 Tax=Actinomadura vinacea TaxID=115336 RepID=A0ABN3IHQ5_9ACTN